MIWFHRIALVLAAILFLTQLYPIVGVVFAILLFWPVGQRKKAAPPTKISLEKSAQSLPAHTELTQLEMLRMELQAHYESGVLGEEQYRKLCQRLDARCAAICRPLWDSQPLREEQREIAWQILEQTTPGWAVGNPPWQKEEAPAQPVAPKPATSEAQPVIRAKPVPQLPAPAHKPVEPPEPAPTPAPEAVPPIAARTPTEPQPTPPPAAKPIATPTPHISPEELEQAEPLPAETPRHPAQKIAPKTPSVSPQPLAPKPAEPGVLPTLLEAEAKARPSLTRRLREYIATILMPFLWQNIGWFIGGFMVVSGSVFLVAYSSGFAKSLLIFVILTFYALLLGGGGYYLRRKRPELVLSSNVLMILCVLLIPLALATAVRGIESAWPNPLLLGLAITLSLAALGAFAVALKLASGLIHRGLLPEHPRLLLALASLQFAVPLLSHFALLQHWPAVVVWHLLLLALLAYALRRFAQRWLHEIFIDQRKTAYYAAGVLIYAALVSFIHITWGSGVSLPAGYSGPFLMALCLLLFYADVHLKEWVHKQAVLNRFSFLIYALAAPAILVAARHFYPLAATLGLAVFLYGGMLWRYLTLPPLYLLLGSFSGLYALLLLQHFPQHWHFLLSLPGLGGILALQSLALKREASGVAKICARTFLALGGALVLWSLLRLPPEWTAPLSAWFAPPGWVAMSTALIASIVVMRIQYRALTTSGVMSEVYGYTWALLVTLTLAYAPLLIAWRLQFSATLLLLSAGWAVLLLRGRRGQARLPYSGFTVPMEVLLNSILLSLLLSVALVWLHWPMLSGNPYLHGSLIGAGGVLLVLSLRLRLRSLFYLALILEAVAIFLLKRYLHLPTLSGGNGTLLIAVLTAALLWWLDRRMAVYEALPLAEPKDTPMRMLWVLPIQPETYRSAAHMAILPLQHALYAVWLYGLFKVGLRLYGAVFNPPLGWAFTALLAALATVLVAGRSRTALLLTVAMVLVIAAGLTLVPLSVAWLPPLAGAAALLVWGAALKLLRPPCTWPVRLHWQGGYGPLGGCRLSEQTLHWSGAAIQVASVVAVGWLAENPWPLFASCAVWLLFFGFSGQRYRLVSHSYLALGGAGTGLLLAGSWGTGMAPLALLQTPVMLFAVVLAALALVALAQSLHHFPEQQELYEVPLYHTAYLCYSGVLLYALGLMLDSWSEQAGLGWVTLLFVLLALAAVPLSRRQKEPETLRGVMTPLLLSLAFAALLPFWWFSPSHLSYALLGWSLLLWLMGYYLLPRWNRYQPQWAIAPAFYYVLTLFSYAGALLGGLFWFADNLQAGVTDPWLAGLFGLFAVTSIPLAAPLPDSTQWRGVALPLLLTLAVMALTPFRPMAALSTAYLLLAWALVLWSMGHLLLPRWNAGLPAWGIAPLFSKLLALFCYLVALLAGIYLLTDNLERGITDPWLALLFSLFAFSQIPLLTPLPRAPLLRGLSLPVLLTLAWAVLLPVRTLPEVLLVFGLLAWSLLLWGAGRFGVPWWNGLKPGWKINQPVWLALALLSYGGALVVGLALFVEGQHTGRADWHTALLFTLLAGSQLRIFALAPQIRGVNMALLFTLAFFSLFPLGRDTLQGMLVWAYLLWLLANTALPVWNRRLPDWEITPDFWPILGLVLTGGSLVLAFAYGQLDAMFGVATSLYGVLALRNIRWGWLPWLVGLGLTVSGIAAILAGMSHSCEVLCLIAISALWLNLLPHLHRLASLPPVQRGLPLERLAQPLLIWPGLVLMVLLAGMAVVVNGQWVGLWPNSLGYADKLNIIFPISLWLTLSLLHFTWLSRWRVTTHALFLAGMVTAVAAFGPWLRPSLLLSSWSALLLLAMRVGSHLRATDFMPESQFTLLLYQAAKPWLVVSFSLALLMLFWSAPIFTGQFLLSGVLLSTVAAVSGFSRPTADGLSQAWLIAALALGVLVLHSAWLWWLPEAPWAAFAPWFALQNAALALLGRVLLRPGFGKPQGAWLARVILPLASMLAAGCWLWHGVVFIQELGAPHPTTLFGWPDNLAAIAAALLLASVGIRHSRLESDGLIYLLALLAGLLGLYLRLLWLGPVPLNVWDTAAIMVAAYLCLILHRLYSAQAFYRLAMGLPVAALLTVPLQLESMQAGGALLAAAALYFLIRREQAQRLPIYLGLLALNAAMYLWLPGWFLDYRLLSLLITPAAVTVLLMLQLHWLELKPSLIHAVRLTALGALYSAATLDVFFLRPEISLFILALALSLSGIILGIALHIRAFLYTGTIFLVLNVVGQLVQFTPQEWLARGIILSVLGALIIAGMIGFNIQREAILQQLRLIRADLEAWE